MTQLILVRYGELGLKGKNRSFFEDKLIHNMRKALRGRGKTRVFRTRGRLFVEIITGDREEIISRLQNVFGIASLSPVTKAAWDLEDIKEKALTLMQEVHRPGESFKVESRRSNKTFPLKSPEVTQEVSSYILEHMTQLPVDVHKPKHVLKVEIRDEEAYVFTDAYKGAGGLPVGVTGKGLLLLSGGIDSPVAASMAFKRGVEVEALHFHSFPFTSERSREKVLDLCRVLSRYNGGINLHVASFTELQKAINRHCPQDWGVIIMRRMMLRIAARVAKKNGAGALFTGENLGQVASQTMESISVIEKVVDLPVLRPLLGFDKWEIIKLAEKIGTYSISIRPFEDCCTIFVAKHPVTRPRAEDAEEIEAAFDYGPLLDDCMENIETLRITEK